MQWESLTNAFPISFFTHGSRRGVERPKKRREWLHEAVDFIRVFASLEVCQNTPKKAKIRATLIVMFHPFSSPQKAPNSSLLSLQKGPDCVADCTGKAI